MKTKISGASWQSCSQFLQKPHSNGLRNLLQLLCVCWLVCPPPFVISRPQFKRALFVGNVLFFFLFLFFKFYENTATTLLLAWRQRAGEPLEPRRWRLNSTQHTSEGPHAPSPDPRNQPRWRADCCWGQKRCTQMHHKDYGQRACAFCAPRERKYLFIQATGGSLYSPIKERDQKTPGCDSYRLEGLSLYFSVLLLTRWFS